jgi:hypothetical protein
MTMSEKSFSQKIAAAHESYEQRRARERREALKFWSRDKPSMPAVRYLASVGDYVFDATKVDSETLMRETRGQKWNTSSTAYRVRVFDPRTKQWRPCLTRHDVSPFCLTLHHAQTHVQRWVRQQDEEQVQAVERNLKRAEQRTLVRGLGGIDKAKAALADDEALVAEHQARVAEAKRLYEDTRAALERQQERRDALAEAIKLVEKEAAADKEGAR